MIIIFQELTLSLIFESYRLSDTFAIQAARQLMLGFKPIAAGPSTQRPRQF
jgi:hypothetical protein